MINGIIYGFDYKELSIFNTKIPKTPTSKQKECVVICKEKITKMEKLSNAIEYYKKSSYYKFNKRK